MFDLMSSRCMSGGKTSFIIFIFIIYTPTHTNLFAQAAKRERSERIVIRRAERAIKSKRVYETCVRSLK